MQRESPRRPEEPGIASGGGIPMDLGLAGKTAVVTGGSKGIGLAVVRGLAASGVRVVTGARTSPAGLEDLTGDGSVQVIEVDLASPDGPDRLAAAAGDRIGILVNKLAGAPAPTGGVPSIAAQPALP